jgi:hypothetical protein
MFLCDDCEADSGLFSVDGDSRCEKHGLSSFHIEPLKIYCASCAKKAQRCQKCACYVNEKDWEEKHFPK